MKILGISQRVEHVENYSEKRDCLDQQWSKLAYELGFIPVPLPNIQIENIPELITTLGIDAILLSGGNSIATLNPDSQDAAPERDAFETTLITFALSNNIPIVGVCRGMQMINCYFGGELLPIEKHVAIKHKIYSQQPEYSLPKYVNSYHNWAIKQNSLPSKLRTIALDSAGYVEAFDSIEDKVLGLMWHPEREAPFNPKDIQLLKRFLL
jgi:putative glutamine amidotransferase